MISLSFRDALSIKNFKAFAFVQSVDSELENSFVFERSSDLYDNTGFSGIGTADIFCGHIHHL
jgi:hypothetical protein